MNIRKIISTTLLAIAPMSLPVFAGGYITGSIGNSNFELDDLPNDFSSDTAWSFGGGYVFNNIFAIEASYLNLGTFGISASDDTISAKLEYDHSGYNVIARVGGNVTEKFALYGRAGLYFYDLDTTVELIDLASGASESGTVEDSGSDITYGLGASYAINESITLLTEYNIYNITFGTDDTDEDSGNTSVFSLGLSYNF